MPHVLSADAERFPFYKSIESKVSIPVAYRMRQCDTIMVAQSNLFSWHLGVKNAPEKPRWVVIGFQTEKSGRQTTNLRSRKLEKYVRYAKFDTVSGG